MTFLSAVVLSLALASQSQTPDRRAEAERLAKAGSYAEALKQFQALAADNPDDLAARMWIGRLLALTGHPERAADVFQSIAAAQPQNVEALVGLGSALTTAGQFTDAGVALNRAEAIASDRPEVLAAQGRLHRAAGRTTLALAYYERALLINPSDDAARAARDAMRAERAHRVQATYYFERFNFDDVPDTHAGTIEVNGHVNDSVRLFGIGQYQRKLDLDEARAGGGITWRHAGNFQLETGALFGDTEVLPDAETFFDIGYSSGRLRWLAGWRYVHFDPSTTLVLTPGLTFAITDHAFVTLKYYRSSTDFHDAGANTANNGFGLRVSGTPSPRLTLTGGYLRGFEGLESITSERLSQLDADTVSAGFRFDLTPMSTVGATYEHQWRSDTTRVSAAYLSFIQRF